MEDDDRDRRREIEELETLRLEVMEKQARDKLGRGAVDGSSSESSPRREDDDEDMEVPPRHELEENIPLTKAGYSVPASFTQIQVSIMYSGITMLQRQIIVVNFSFLPFIKLSVCLFSPRSLLLQFMHQK